MEFYVDTTRLRQSADGIYSEKRLSAALNDNVLRIRKMCPWEADYSFSDLWELTEEIEKYYSASYDTMIQICDDFDRLNRDIERLIEEGMRAAKETTF